MELFRVCKSVHHHTFNWINQPDAANSQVYYFFFFQALNFLDESFGLLNDLFPLPSILDSGCPVFDLHLTDVLCDVILPSVLGSCDLLVRGFQLNIFLTVLVSGILCMWPNRLSLWVLMWLIIFCVLSPCLILHWFLHLPMKWLWLARISSMISSVFVTSLSSWFALQFKQKIWHAQNFLLLAFQLGWFHISSAVYLSVPQHLPQKYSGMLGSIRL